jgi:hypothetical protein
MRCSPSFAVEFAKAQEEDSVFRIRSVLTDKEASEKVLEQGLKKEHIQYKDSGVNQFIILKYIVIITTF